MRRKYGHPGRSGVLSLRALRHREWEAVRINLNVRTQVPARIGVWKTQSVFNRRTDDYLSIESPLRPARLRRPDCDELFRGPFSFDRRSEQDTAIYRIMNSM